MAEEEWQKVDGALADLAGSGRQARFWWRDDDAIDATPQLDRLIGLAGACRVPVLLAVIPKYARPELAARLAGEASIVPAVHGWAHVSHAPAGEKKQELGSHRGADAVLRELAAGRERLVSLFGGTLVPVLVPPWNRIVAPVVAGLGSAGFAGLSSFGAEGAIGPVHGLRIVNTHLDPVDWHGSRGLADRSALIEAVAKHLHRCAFAGHDAPLGLLTHHLIHDDAVWWFVEALLRRTADHPACRWCDPRALFSAHDHG